MKNILTKDNGDLTVKFDGQKAEISFDDIIINCLLLDSRYPNYNSVIPKNNPCRGNR